MPARDRELWDKRDDESLEAFEAFSLYRDGAESIAEVAQGLTKSEALLRRWSRTYAWKERRAAWVAVKDQTATKARLRVIGDTEEQRAKEVADMNNRHATYAMLLLQKVSAKLKTLDVRTIKPKDLAHWLDIAVKVERLARGASTSEVSVTGQDGGAIKLEVQQQAAERVASIVGSILAEGEESGLVGKPN